MKKPCIAFGAAIVLAAQFSTAHAIEFKNAVVGQTIEDRALTVGKLSLQLPGAQWILASKVQGMGTLPGVANQPVPTPPLQTLAAVQMHNRTILAIVIFSAPAWSYSTIGKWNEDPCKGITSFITKSTLNQTITMPECFAIANQAAGWFQVSTDTTHQDLVRWAGNNGYALPDQMLRVLYTKYHRSDFFQLNAYMAGSLVNAPAAEAWGREAVASLSAMVTRSTAQGKLPELPAFAATPAAEPPVAPRAQPAAAHSAPASNSAESRLRQLKSLLDSNLITPEEYEGKRKKIVDEM